MKKAKIFIKKTVVDLANLVPFGRDIFLVLTKSRQDISYRGCFDTFDQAEKAALRTKTSNYDVINANKAKNDTHEKQRLDHWFHDIDYPLLFWLSKLLAGNGRVLELGGSLGHFFYSIQKYITFPSGLIWTIVELPEAVKFGRAIALERQEERLFFADRKEVIAVAEVDIFVTAGTLQYMEESLFEIIQACKQRPKHVLVHNLPVHRDKQFFTLQNLIACEVPYRIYSKSNILRTMDDLGYCLNAQWANPRYIEIPFHRKMEIEGYIGFYFSKKKQ